MRAPYVVGASGHEHDFAAAPFLSYASEGSDTKRNEGSGWTALASLVLAFLCCGLPLVLVALGSVVGSVSRQPLVMAGGVAIVAAGVGGYLFSRRRAKKEECCD